MNMSRLLHIRVSAPAVVVLATVVNAAAAGDQAFGLAQNPAHDLSWVVRGGVSQSAQITRSLLAKKAVKTIHSLDQISGAQTATPSGDFNSAAAPVSPFIFIQPDRQPACSSHQHSAP